MPPSTPQLSYDEGGDVPPRTAAPGGDIAAAWPIGSLFLSAVATNPATLLGFGAWSPASAGRMLVGVDPGDPDFDTTGETGGAKTVTLTAAEMPAHTHTQDAHGHGVTDGGHNHTQAAHGHGVTDPTHNHTQNSHNHTQDAHTHVQNAHSHGMAEGTTDGSGTFVDRSNAAAATTATTDAATATNQNATATNQAATATNNAASTGLTVNDATAANNAATTGVSVNSATVTNQSAGSGGAHSNMPPYLV